MKFAISIPVGAWHDFLPYALKSLSVQEVELSVGLLDASGDPRVRALADEYDDLLTYRRHGPDSGQSDALIEGWANLDGDWLGWLNADDMLMPDAMVHAANAVRADPAMDVVYGHSTVLNEAGDMTGYHFNVEPPGERLLQAGIISQPSCFFSRAAYESAGGLDRSLHYVMDWDLWIRMYKSGADFRFINTPMSMVLWGASTKTASLNRRRREELRMLISRHAPHEAQKSTYRDFAIHALTDMIWPRMLREKVIRKLRGVGPSVFGVRADGRLASAARLTLAHYTDSRKDGLTFHFDRSPACFSASLDEEPLEVRPNGAQVRIYFPKSLAAGQRIDVHVQHQTAPDLYFKRAAWLSE